jgi:hypothetical protein
MIVTRILKPEMLNAVTLVRIWLQVLGQARSKDSLLDLNQRVLDQLVAEGILA